MSHWDVFKCQQCGKDFNGPRMGRRRPKYCSNACRQKAYRESVKESGVTKVTAPTFVTSGPTRNASKTSGSE